MGVFLWQTVELPEGTSCEVMLRVLPSYPSIFALVPLFNTIVLYHSGTMVAGEDGIPVLD